VARLIWSVSGTRLYEAGIDRGVLYVDGFPGVPWTGLTSVEMNPTGGGTKSYYLDGNKYLIASSAEEFGATINAFTYPDLFARCDGTAEIRTGLRLTQQRRKSFGFSYRTLVGSDLNGDLGYKIHIVYNALAEPTQRSYSSLSDSTDPVEFSWNVTTRPPVVSGYKRTSHVEIDSRTTDSQVLELIENALYGDEENAARLPSFSELVEMYDAFFVFVVTDNGDRTFTISGPDEAIEKLDDIYLQFDWPTVVSIDENTYTISDG
jgi:hypothetical protein